MELSIIIVEEVVVLILYAMGNYGELLGAAALVAQELISYRLTAILSYRFRW